MVKRRIRGETKTSKNEFRFYGSRSTIHNFNLREQLMDKYKGKKRFHIIF